MNDSSVGQVPRNAGTDALRRQVKLQSSSTDRHIVPYRVANGGPKSQKIPVRNQESNSIQLENVWLIEGPHRLEKISDRQIVKRRRFLQIGTGQWTSSQYATHFPRRGIAATYAREFGLMMNGDVKVISVRQDRMIP